MTLPQDGRLVARVIAPPVAGLLESQGGRSVGFNAKTKSVIKRYLASECFLTKKRRAGRNWGSGSLSRLGSGSV